MQEQCVTSAGWIAYNAQQLTKSADIGRIDASLDVSVSPGLLKNGKLSKNKKRQREVVSVPEQGLAAMIVVARMHPNSDYSKSTGNRWPVAIPNTHGVAAFWSAVQMIAARMIKARHSSANFIKHGWVKSIRDAFGHIDFQHSAKYRNADRAMGDQVNRLNTTNLDDLGKFFVAGVGDSVSVTAENNVGDATGKSNDKLARKHHMAVLEYGLPALNESIAFEERTGQAELERRLLAGVVPIQKME